MKELKPIQKEALKWAKDKDQVAFFMEMRLGKTLTSIRWANQRNRVLVITPVSCFGSWKEQLNEEAIQSVDAGWVRYDNVDKLINMSETHWVLCNGQAHKILEKCFKSRRFDVCILDESILIRNPNTIVGKLFVKYRHWIKRKALLSGLPDPESMVELINQFIWLKGNFMGYNNPWQAINNLTIKTRSGAVMKRGMIAKVKRWIDRHAFTKTQKEGGINVGKKFNLIRIPPNALQKEFMKDIVNNWELNERATKYNVVAQGWLRRVAGGFALYDNHWEVINTAKAYWIARHAHKTSEQLIVWCHYTKEARLVEKILNGQNINTTIMLSSYSAKNRQAVLESFNDGSYQVLVSQLKLGAYGWTLNNCNNAVYYSLPWSGNVWNQTKARIVLEGKKQVGYHILLTKNSIDEGVWDALQHKAFTPNAIIKNFLKGK